MVDNTFGFQVRNLSEPFFDIIGGSLYTLDMTLLMDLVEDGIVDCNVYPVVITINIHNTGELPATKDIVLKDSEGAILETQSIEIPAGRQGEVWFTNAAAGYNVADGTTQGFSVEAG